MISTMQVYVVGGILTVALLILGVYLKMRPRKLNTTYYIGRWQTLQKLCSNNKNWHVAITDADRLLDDVLKRLKYKGKTTGERLVSAQHDFSNNEALWFGHKLRNRITYDALTKLSKRDTLQALGGFRQALKDLGAFEKKAPTSPTLGQGTAPKVPEESAKK